MKHIRPAVSAVAAAVTTGIAVATAPSAMAETHTITYTVWIDGGEPAQFPIGYNTADGPNAPRDVANVWLEPGQRWVQETTMNDPRWAYVNASIGGGGTLFHVDPARTASCEIRVDGVVKNTGSGTCSLKVLSGKGLS